MSTSLATSSKTRPRPGVVHFGVGGFHRAHQAVYLNELLEKGGADDWGIVGVGVLPGDVAMRDALASQNYEYTVVTKHASGDTDVLTVRSIVDFLYAPEQPEAVLDLLADPQTRIVSLTITEGGYYLNDATGEPDANSPQLVADAQTPQHPKTVFGYLAEGLRRRKAKGVQPFTVLSCDNIPGNGEVARKALVGYANLVDKELADWISSEVVFPSSMVDRITPVTTDADREALEEDSGIVDAWPVVAEPFTQWVLEDNFVAGRPDLEAVGVQLVPDVAPYENMKLRMLNGSHQALAYLGWLLGYRDVHDAMADPLLKRFLWEYMTREAAPTLPPTPGVDIEEYRDTLLERFSNPHVGDSIARLAAETSDRIPKFVLPVAHAHLTGVAAQPEVSAVALIVASWVRYLQGVDEQGDAIPVVDRRRKELVEAAQNSDTDPLRFLQNEELFGTLADEQQFVDGYVRWLNILQDEGAEAALTEYFRSLDTSGSSI